MEKTQNSHIVRFVGQNPRPPNTPTTLVLGAESRCNVRLAKKVGQNQRPFIAAVIADPALADTGDKEVRLLGKLTTVTLATPGCTWHIRGIE